MVRVTEDGAVASNVTSLVVRPVKAGATGNFERVTVKVPPH